LTVSFNPRPALRPGEAARSHPTMQSSMFQSAPGFEAGRSSPCSGAVWSKKEFQSAPGFEAGRSKLGGRAQYAHPSWFQSAPGFEAGRSQTGAVVAKLDMSFNPRPALRPGEARMSFWSSPMTSGFQSAPGFEAGRSGDGDED